MTAPTAPIRLTVWSDFLCPWCYVGAFRLADLADLYGDRISVQWRSHVLRPEAKRRNLERFRDYTRLWSAGGGPGAHEARCDFRVWENSEPPTHSIPAAVAAKVAAEIDEQVASEFRMALFRAYFTEHRTISDLDVLADIARECGLDRDQFSEQMRTRGAAVTAIVLAEHVAGIELGAHAAPTVVVNDVLPIPGAQELDTYRRIIDKILLREDDRLRR